MQSAMLSPDSDTDASGHLINVCKAPEDPFIGGLGEGGVSQLALPIVMQVLLCLSPLRFSRADLHSRPTLHGILCNLVWSHVEVQGAGFAC